jgi:pimeloyl-ACP methyl ester carboxylesterase
LRFQQILSYCINFSDVKEVIESIWKNDVPPQIVLVGHSMGGALAVHTAALNYVNNLIGLVVIDVVEGWLFSNCLNL